MIKNMFAKKKSFEQNFKRSYSITKTYLTLNFRKKKKNSIKSSYSTGSKTLLLSFF